MSQTDKLLAKARRNPAGLSFAEFERLLARTGWVFKRQRGSHRFWKSPSGKAVPFQSYQGQAKAYQVKQYLADIDERHRNEQ
jgi:hypothetical protein